MNGQRSSRTLVAAGLLISLLIGVVISARLLRDATTTQTEWREERIAVIALNSLIDLVERAGDNQDVVSAVVERWREVNPSITGVRVTDLDNRSITATTHKEDLDRGEVPRRLVREEKPIFDRAQRIATNVEENLAGGSPRAEIEMERTADGGFALAGPVDRDGQVVGMVEITRKPETSGGRMPGVPMGLAILAPVVIFALVAAFVGERRMVLFLIALLLLTVALVAYGRYSLGTIGGAGASVESQLAQRVAAQTERSRAIISELKLSPTPEITPAKWDTDLLRRPRAKAGAADAAPGVTRAIAGIWVISALALAFIGLGWAGRLGRGARKHRQAVYYTAPAMIGMLLLVFFPFFYGIMLSFTDQTIYTTNKPLTEIFVGLRNYVDIVGHFDIVKRAGTGLIWNYDNFYWTLLFTVAWTVINVTIGVTLGLLLALILNTKGLALKPIYRVLLILPWAVPNYITALIWRGMFHQQFGVINQLIQMFGGEPVAWFDHTLTSFAALVTTNGWLSFPFMMVISLGALQSISADLYEAARVDGASRWQQFKSITLPSLKPALIPAIILSVVWTFNMFNIIYLVSAGNPAGSTEILITKAYKIAFEQYRYGYAAAYSTVIFIILLIYGTWQNKVTKATEAI